jgi:hypothetical protein
VRTLNHIRTSRHIRGFRTAAHATGFASAPVQPLWEAARMARGEMSRRMWLSRLPSRGRLAVVER